MPKAAQLQIVTPWSPGIKPTWTVSEVRAALRSHREGDFSRSAMLVDSMGEDDALPGFLDKRIDGLMGRDFCLDPVANPNRKLSKRIADQLGPVWWDMVPEAELKDLLRWFRMLRVAVGVLVWTREVSGWKPRLKVLPPHFLRYDEHRQIWLYQAREGEFVVTPGDGRWLLLTEGQRSWMYGSVRPLAIPWVSKGLTILDWNRYNERHGLPILKAKAPMVSDEADRDQFWEDMKGLQGEAVVQLPTHIGGADSDVAFDLELLEAKDRNWESFQALLDRCDRRFMVHLLGGNLSTEVVDQGAYSTAKNHDDQLLALVRAESKAVTTLLRAQVLAPTAIYNFPGATLETTPWPKWDTDPLEDEKRQAEAAGAFGNAIKAVQDAGYEVENVDELAERYHLKLKKREGGGAPGQPAARRPPAPADDEEDEDETEEDEEQPAAFGSRILASGASAAANQGFVEGQLHVDAVVEQATARAMPRLAALAKDVAREIEAASDYEDLRRRLRKLYAGTSPEQLNAIVQKAMMLAELSGRAAVLQDL